MAKAKEFTVTIADKPGALGNCFLALAERGVNVLAFQSYVEDRESLARFLADDVAAAKAVLSSLRMLFEETGVAGLFVTHPPVASRIARLRALDPGWRERLRAA